MLERYEANGGICEAFSQICCKNAESAFSYEQWKDGVVYPPNATMPHTHYPSRKYNCIPPAFDTLTCVHC